MCGGSGGSRGRKWGRSGGAEMRSGFGRESRRCGKEGKIEVAKAAIPVRVEPRTM